MAGWLTLQLSGVSFSDPWAGGSRPWLPHLESWLSREESHSGPPALQALLATTASSQCNAPTIFKIELVHISQGTECLKICLKGWG